MALKRLKMEKEKEGFPITSLREINTILKAQHPNIVTVRVRRPAWPTGGLRGGHLGFSVGSHRWQDSDQPEDYRALHSCTHLGGLLAPSVQARGLRLAGAQALRRSRAAAVS